MLKWPQSQSSESKMTQCFLPFMWWWWRKLPHPNQIWVWVIVMPDYFHAHKWPCSYSYHTHGDEDIDLPFVHRRFQTRSLSIEKTPEAVVITKLCINHVKDSSHFFLYVTWEVPEGPAVRMWPGRPCSFPYSEVGDIHTRMKVGPQLLTRTRQDVIWT